MKAILATGTILLVAVMLVGGIYYPTSPLMWLASSTTEYTVVRAIIIVALVAMLLTRPPRKLAVRAMMIGTSIGLMMVALSSLETFAIGLLDAVVFAEVAILLALEGMEITVQPAAETSKKARQVKVRAKSKKKQAPPAHSGQRLRQWLSRG